MTYFFTELLLNFIDYHKRCCSKQTNIYRCTIFLWQSISSKVWDNQFL